MKIRVTTSDGCYDFKGNLRIFDAGDTLNISKADERGEYYRVASFNYWKNWREIT